MKDKITNISKKIKLFFTTHTKMKLLVGYLIVNLLYLTIGSYIFITKNITSKFGYKEFAIGLRYILVLNIIVFLCICVRKKYTKNLAHLGILAAIIVGAISTWFAFDRNIALEGCWGRYEGLYSILYYLSIMLLSTFVSDKYKKALVNCILLCGAFQAGYAVCQCFGWLNVKQFGKAYRTQDEVTHATVTKIRPWILGLTNNPNFFGTYMLLCLSYAIGLFIDSKKWYKCLVYSILIALFMFALLASNATSCLVGLIFVSIYVLIKSIKNRLIIKWLVLLFVLVSITVLAVGLKKTTLITDIQTTKTEATEVVKGNVDNSFGTNRMFIWKKTVEIIPKHFWHGVGVDSFHKAFYGGALTRKTKRKIFLYDKAHNEYLQLLITQGIFALVVYVGLYSYVVFCGVRRSIKYNEVYLVLPVIGYLVQAFFNISVIEVAPIFWMALGLCCGRDRKQENEKS